MAEKNKNNFVVNDKTYVKKPEIHYSYRFQPYIKDLGGSPGKNITQEDRNKRLRHENNVNAVRNVVKGLNNTFGKAISGAAAFYGGGWALNRLLHLNKPSTLGQFFGRYVLPANTADNVSDGVELIFDPSVKGAVDLGTGVVLGRFKDLSKPVRLVGELIGQGANINNMKNGGFIRKMLTAAGGPIINGGTPFSITVKGKDRRPAWERMYLNPNLGDTSKYYNGNILEGVIGLTPGVGDAIDAVKAADAVNNKDYTTAGFLGAGLLLPNIIEKPFKFAKGLYKGYKANKMTKAAREAFNKSGDKLEVDAFKSGSKPMYVTPAKGLGSNHINVISDELKDSKYLDLERPFGKDETLTLRYYINEDKLKQIIGTYKDFYKDRLGLYTNDVDKIYNYIISNPKLLDLNINSGTTGLLDIIGVSLGYGPKDAILFKIGYNGLNKGEKVSKDAIESMKTYGYDRTLPGIYNILKKNIERGTLGVKSTDTNGGHVGFGYVKNRLGGKMNILEFLKNGSGIHIKEKNKGKFTSYCGGKVTDECIRRGKNSSSATIRKRATFAANARKWKHLSGGVMTAGKKAKSNLTKRKDPDWDNLNRGYRYLTLDMKLPHDLAIALMGNVVEESQGNYQAVLKGGPGRGLVLWEKSAPSGRYSLWGKILTSVTKPANVYDPKTDTVKNYWASWNGLKGELVRQRFKTAPLKEKTRIYAESYLRPGKPRIKDRQLSAMLLDSIYNPKIKNIIVNKKGGKAFVEGVNALDSNPKAYKHVKKKYKMALLGTKLQIASAIGNIGMGIFNTIQLNSAIDKSIENIKALAELDKKKLFLLNFKTALGQLTDRSLIVNSNRAFRLAGLTDYSSIDDKFLLLLQELLNLKLENSNKIFNYIGDGILLLANSSLKNNNTSDNITSHFSSFDDYVSKLVLNGLTNGNLFRVDYSKML